MRLRFPLLVCVAFTALPLVAGAATAPRLAGTFQTTFRITAIHNFANTPLHVGSVATKTWTFTPKCATGSCTTILARPSIIPGSTKIKLYTLSALSAREYKGSTAPASDTCILYGTKRSIANAYTIAETLDLHVTKVAAGKVAAYTGTDVVTESPTAAGRAHGCTPAVQDATFTG